MNEENRLKKERTALIALTSVIYALIEENLLETLADYALFALLYGPKAEEKLFAANQKTAVSVTTREETALKKPSIAFSGEGCKDGLNWYVYCSNNPMVIIDPSGLRGEKAPPFLTDSNSYNGVAAPFNFYQGPYNIAPKIGGINTGIKPLDIGLGVFSGIWNLFATGVNTVTNGVGYISEGVNGAIQSIDDKIPDSLSLSGDGLGQDLYLLGLYIGMNPVESSMALSAAEYGYSQVKTNLQGLIQATKGGIPEGTSYSGSIYRAVPKQYADDAWDIHAGNISASHRYSSTGRGALYSGTSEESVMAELMHYGIDVDDITMVSKDISVQNILDLTNETVRNQLGVSMEQIISNDYTITQAIGDFAQGRYEGILVPSARAEDASNLILFGGN